MKYVPGQKLIVIAKATVHQDTKTVSTHPHQFPYLYKGDRVEFVKETNNLHGTFVHVKFERDGKMYYYDLNPQDVKPY